MAASDDNRTFTRQSTQSIRRAFSVRMRKSAEDLAQVTGDIEDVQVDADLATGETALTFENVSYSVPAKGGAMRSILEPMSAHIEPGTLVALMGPSGSGKSTLLQILANKKRPPYGGTIHVNGRPRDRLFQRMIAFVPQDDFMPAHLTVEEAVMFHSELKAERPSKLTHEMAMRYNRRRLEVLGMSEISRSLIGDGQVRGISGGQKRRLSLACGLAWGAQLIFCDEPTSGLSATDAEACVRYMRLMAHKYCITIIVVIHQPRVEVSRLFDHLLLLTSQPGRLVYNGPMRELTSHCEKVGFPVPNHSNATDFCMDMVTPGLPKAHVDEFEAYYEAHCKPAVVVKVGEELGHARRTPLEILEHCRQRMLQWGDLPPIRNSIYGVTFRRQLQMLFWRQTTLRFRDKWFIIADMLMAIGKAVVVGLAYVGIAEFSATFQVGFFFMALMSCTLDGLKAMPWIISERTIMKMETSEALYSEWAYIIVFTILSGIQALLAHTIFVVILFFMAGLKHEIFWSLYFWSTLLYFTMDGLYLMIASIARTTTAAQMMSLPFLLIFLLYNGFTVTRISCPWWLLWAVEISPVAYAMEAIVIAAQRANGGGQDYDLMVSVLGYKDEPGRALVVMLCFMAGFRLVQVGCLKCLNNIRF